MIQIFLSSLYAFSCGVLLVHAICKLNHMGRRANHGLRLAYVCMVGGSSWQILDSWGAAPPPAGQVALVASCALAVLVWAFTEGVKE